MLRQVVQSKAGKDCGGFFVILAENDGFAYIADGRLRKVEKPKRKNARHLAPTNTVLKPEDCETNKKLRAALAEFNMTDEGGNSLVQRRRD